MKLKCYNLLSDNSGENRNHVVDILKGIAILSVIASHCGFPIFLWINPSTFFLVTFCLISGFYLNTNKNTLIFIKEKFIRLVIPYYKYFFIFATLAFIYDKIFPSLQKNFPDNFFSIYNLLIEPFTQAHQFQLISPLWFLTTLFEGFVIISLFRSCLGRLGKHHKYSLCFIVIFAMICQILVEFPLPSYYIFCERAIMFALFIGIGFLAWQNRQFWDCPYFLFFAAFLFLAIVWRFNPSYIMSYNYYGEKINKHLFVICNLLGFCFTYLLSKLFYENKILSNFLQYCGRHSFSFMALHMTGFFILTSIEKALLPNDVYQKVVDLSYSSGMQRIILFLVGILFPLMICIGSDLFFKKTKRNL